MQLAGRLFRPHRRHHRGDAVEVVEVVDERVLLRLVGVHLELHHLGVRLGVRLGVVVRVEVVRVEVVLLVARLARDVGLVVLLLRERRLRRRRGQAEALHARGDVREDFAIRKGVAVRRDVVPAEPRAPRCLAHDLLLRRRGLRLLLRHARLLLLLGLVLGRRRARGGSEGSLLAALTRRARVARVKVVQLEVVLGVVQVGLLGLLVRPVGHIPVRLIVAQRALLAQAHLQRRFFVVLGVPVKCILLLLIGRALILELGVALLAREPGGFRRLRGAFRAKLQPLLAGEAGLVVAGLVVRGLGGTVRLARVDGAARGGVLVGVGSLDVRRGAHALAARLEHQLLILLFVHGGGGGIHGGGFRDIRGHGVRGRHHLSRAHRNWRQTVFEFSSIRTRHRNRGGAPPV